MSRMIAEIFGPPAAKVKTSSYKARKPGTRSLRRSNNVLDYNTLITSKCPKSDYIQSVLQSQSKIYDGEEIGNFILNIIFPLPAAGSLEISSRKRRDVCDTVNFPNPIGIVKETIAGSTSEGLWLPQITHIKGNSSYTDTPDEDRKIIFTNLVVSSKEHSSFAIPEPSVGSPPVYINLRFNKSFLSKINKNNTKVLNPVEFVRGDGLVDRVKFMAQILAVLKDRVRSHKKEVNSFKCKDTEPKVTFSKHGPAITADIEDTSVRQMISTDYVICLPCPQWPSKANSWRVRQRIWPHREVVKKVVLEGCHIVPKAYKPGKAWSSEFILSFSLCDKTLSKYLSLTQKRCYMLFKYVFKYHINKVKRGLNSYICKTTFLWLCERKPETEWRENNPMECLLCLLHDLKEYLGRGYMPHYYVPECNLIDRISNKSLKACIDDIGAVIASPSIISLELSESHRFSWLSKDVSLFSLLVPLTLEIQTTGKILTSYTLSFLSSMIDKGEVVLVIPTICQEWASEISVDTNRLIKTVEKIVSDNEDTNDMVCFQGLLGNLYHQRANESLERIGYIGESDVTRCMDVFDKILEDVGKHTWIYGAMYDLLYQIACYKDLIRHFLTNLLNGHSENTGYLYEPGIYTSISTHNHLTTYPDEFAMLGTSSIPSTAYIFYKVIYAYVALSDEANTASLSKAYRSEATKVLIHFEKWVKRKCTLYPEIGDDVLYYLLGITAKQVGNKKVLTSSFGEAVKYGTTFLGFEITHETQFYDNEQELNQMQGTRFHPYNKQTRHSPRCFLPVELRFKSGDIRVGPYLHN